MKMIDYDAASKTYDRTRKHSNSPIDRFSQRVLLTEQTTVLDFGCGTGNYLNRLQLDFGCQCCGVEPSEGMRTVATNKNPALDIQDGNHANIPYGDRSFDFGFMTDVIHHVPDLNQMFAELCRVLRFEAYLCIVTQSHDQIQDRFYNGYFPSLASNEKHRYPDIPVIVVVAQEIGLAHEGTEVLPPSSHARITEEFVRNVEEKNYSMFRLLDEAEYMSGLSRIKDDMGKSFDIPGAGETLVWLTRPAQRSDLSDG